MASDLTSFSDLVEKLYRGSLEKRPWLSFIDALLTQIPSTFVYLGLNPASSVLPVYTVAAGDIAADKTYSRDVWLASPFVNIPEGQVVAITEILPREQYESSNYYKMLLEPYDVYHVIGIDIKTPEGLRAQLRLARSKDMGHHSDAERALCQELVAHLRQALEIFMRLDRLASQHDAYASTLDLFPIGMLMLDGGGKVLQQNGVATQILAETSGLIVTRERLTASRPSAAAELQRAIAAAAAVKTTAPTLATAIRIERSGRPDLSIMVRPAPRSGDLVGALRPAVIVLVNDPLRTQVLSARRIAELFNFTATEASLAVLLAGGISIQEAAATLGISLTTARSHLYSMFQKAHVNRQSQLVAYILRSFASLLEACA